MASPSERAEIRGLIEAEGAKASATLDAERGRIVDKLSEIQDQLNRLTSSYARGLVDEESYGVATGEIVAEKTTLKHEKTRLERTGASYWIEPAIQVVTALERAGKIEGSKSPHEISELLRQTGSNLLISRKKVSVEFAQPFDFTSALLAETRATFDTRPCPNWILISRV